MKWASVCAFAVCSYLHGCGEARYEDGQGDPNVEAYDPCFDLSYDECRQSGCSLIFEGECGDAVLLGCFSSHCISDDQCHPEQHCMTFRESPCHIPDLDDGQCLVCESEGSVCWPPEP